MHETACLASSSSSSQSTLMGVVDKPPTLCVCAVFLAAVRLIDPRRQVQFKMRCGWPCVRSTVCHLYRAWPPLWHKYKACVRHLRRKYPKSLDSELAGWNVRLPFKAQVSLIPVLGVTMPAREHWLRWLGSLGTGEAASPQLRDWLRLPGQPLCLH